MVAFRRYNIIVLIIAGVASLHGCGSRNPATHAVTGTVSYQGKLVEGAGVMFMPSSGRPASGRTDAQGRFTLRTYKDGDGAIVGENVVSISKMIPVPGDDAKDPMLKRMSSVLPTRYATPTTSPLKATVSAAGPNDFTFELTDDLPSSK